MSPRAICPPHFVEGAAALKLSPAIWSRGHVFLTGVTGSAPDGSISGDPHTQFRAVFEKVSATLAAAGIDFGSVVEMTSYHIDITTHFDAFADVRADYVVQPYPAWTAIEVAGLRRTGALVELRVVAEAPES